MSSSTSTLRSTPRGAANIKSDKDRTKLVRTYGLYLASDQNEHGLVLTPDRTIESYRLKPDDILLFKKRPKDTAEMLITSHAKTAAAAQVSTFVRIVFQAENAQATFKFASTVTVQQAISKASRKFGKYGAYGLQLPKGKNVKKTIWLEPQRLLSSYGLENMCTLEFLARSGAVITTPTDDIGDADTTVALPQDDSPSLPPPAHFSSGSGNGGGYDRVPQSSSTASTMRINPGAATGTFGGGTFGGSTFGGGTISSPPPPLNRDSYESMANSQYPPSNKYPPAAAIDPYSNSYGQPPGSMPPPPAFQTQPINNNNFSYGQPPGGLPPPGRRPGPAGGTFGGAGGTMSLPPPIAPAAPPSDLDVLDDLLGDIPGIDTSQILDNAEPKPARNAPSTMRPAAMPAAPMALPPPIRGGGGGGGGAPPPARVSAMPPPPAFGTMSLPPPPAVSNSFRAPEWEKDDEELHALDSAPAAATGGDDEWAAIDECLDFDLEF
jgi:hypothetical protein